MSNRPLEANKSCRSKRRLTAKHNLYIKIQVFIDRENKTLGRK